MFAGDIGTILHYDGTAWSPYSSRTTLLLSAVWGNSGTDVFAVGYNGTIVHYDGTDWTRHASGTSAWLFGVWGAGPMEVGAVEEGGEIRVGTR